MKHTFTAPVAVWLSEYSHHDAASLQQADSIEGLTLTEPDADWSNMKYTKVGAGEVTVTLASRDEIIGSKVDSLREQLQQDRAESQLRQNALIDQISKLEALTYEPSEAA